MQVSVNMTLFQRENRYTWLFFVPSPSVHFLLVLYSYKCTCACACAIVHACQTQKSQMWLCSNRVTGYNVTKVFNKFKNVPLVVPQIVASGQQDRSTLCMHCTPTYIWRLYCGNNMNNTNHASANENSVYTSCLLTNSSNLSVSPGRDLCHFANGLIISGWLMINVGFTHVSSKKWPTNYPRVTEHISI